MSSEVTVLRLDELTDGSSITYGVVKPGDECPCGIKFIRGGDIVAGRILNERLRTITPEVSAQYSRTLLKGGELLVSLVGNPGEVAIVSDSLRGANIARQVGLIRIDSSKADINYVQYFFRSKTGKNLLLAHSKGSVQQVINLKDLKSVKVPLPALDEQKSISSFMQWIDDRIDLLHETNTTLEAIAQALFKSWFVDYDPVHAKINGSAPEGMDEATASLFPGSFQESELGSVPEGWRITSVSDIADIVKGKSYSSKDLVQDHHTALVTLKSFNRGGGFRLDGFKPYTGGYKSNQVVCPGDLIVAYTDVTQAAELIGKPAIVVGVETYKTMVASLDVGVVRPIAEFTTRQFLYGLFRTPLFQSHTFSHTSGTTVLHLGKDGVGSFRFALPPLNVVAKFSEIAESIAKNYQNNVDQSRTLSTLRDTLLPRLISGQLRVSEAEELIETASQ